MPRALTRGAVSRCLASTRFERGANGRIERVLYAGGGQKVVSYGLDGQPEQVTLPQGTALSYEHDSAHRELSRTSSLGETRSFTYGAGDRIESMTDDTGSTLYEYDSAGRFSGIVYPHGGSVRYDRDKLGRTTAVRVQATPSAPESVTSYVYDDNGNLEQLTDPLGGVTLYEYDEVDRLTERTLPNGVSTSYAYDARDRVLSVVHRGPMSNVLASVLYERSASGEPTRITREDGSYVVLSYDAALRIDTETYYDASAVVVDAIDYDYDLDGNRTSKTSLTGGYESYAYEAGFKLTSITTPSETEQYGYDGGGRATSITRGGAQWTLEHNSDDKLTRVLEGGSEVVRYVHDGAGRRVGAVEAGDERRYLVAPNVGDGFETPQAVTDGAGVVLASYVFAGEQPIARITSGGVEYYLQDAMGSVIGMADAAGSSTVTIKYDSFGQVTSAVGAGAAIPSSVGTEFRYHGMQLDAASGLYHVRARTYDARTGRFLERDPVAGVTGRPESMNPYVMDHGNPRVWRDPSGLFTLSEVAITSAVIGVLATAAVAAYRGFLMPAKATTVGSNPNHRDEVLRWLADLGPEIVLLFTVAT